MTTTTREKFAAYVRVQRSGKTNMLDVSEVRKLARPVTLTDWDVYEIRKNYARYASEYPEVTRS